MTQKIRAASQVSKGVQATPVPAVFNSTIFVKSVVLQMDNILPGSSVQLRVMNGKELVRLFKLPSGADPLNRSFIEVKEGQKNYDELKSFLELGPGESLELRALAPRTGKPSEAVPVKFHRSDALESESVASHPRDSITF